MSQVWFISGSGRGLGKHITEQALRAGHRVVAGVRESEQLTSLHSAYPDTLQPVPLDVTSPAQARSALEVAMQRFGRVDVLVNNAGFGNFSPFEQISEADFRAQIDTNFYGVVHLTRAALPIMRRQRGGHILQISSVGGRLGSPGLSAYQAAKWAVAGFTEVLAQEVGPLGIKVCCLEPGGMATDWGRRAVADLPELEPDYLHSMGGLLEQFRPHLENPAGDPSRVAAIVLRLAAHPNPPVRLLLGSDAVYFAGESEAARASTDQRWRSVSLSSDFTAPAFAELPQN